MPTSRNILTFALLFGAACGAPSPAAQQPGVVPAEVQSANTAQLHSAELAVAPTVDAAATAPPNAVNAKKPSPDEIEPISGFELQAVHPELLTGCAEHRSIVVYKAARQLELRCGEQVAARYGISLGFEPTGDKHNEGDGRTPEGEYLITGKFSSQFHRSLQLAYPNADDAARGLEEKQISRQQHDTIVRALRSCRRPPQNTALGSLLQIHGGGGGPEYPDWTLGCIALTNDAIDAAYAFHLPGCDGDGRPRTPARILP